MLPDGSPVKDGNYETRTHEELSKLSQLEIIKSWPPLTKGTALLALINNKKDCKDIEEMGELQRLLVKIRTKTKLDTGKWNINKEELLALKKIFDNYDPKQLHPNLHGQLYNEITDLLLKVSV